MHVIRVEDKDNFDAMKFYYYDSDFVVVDANGCEWKPVFVYDEIGEPNYHEGWNYAK